MVTQSACMILPLTITRNRRGEEKMTSKQRAYLKGLASTLDSIFDIGKSGVTPELTDAVSDALRARELIKLNVLKSCEADVKTIADTIADRTRSQVVQVIGRKIVLYKQAKEEKDRRIVLPPAGRAGEIS